MPTTPRKLLEQLVRRFDEGDEDYDCVADLVADARTLLEPQTQPTTQGEIMAAMFTIREQERELNEELKALGEQYAIYEALMIAKCDEHGATRISSPLGTAVVTTTILPQVADWDAFYTYVKDNDAFHLLQRRIASAAFREVHATGDTIPGLQPYAKRSINLRAS